MATENLISEIQDATDTHHAISLRHQGKEHIMAQEDMLENDKWALNNEKEPMQIGDNRPTGKLEPT